MKVIIFAANGYIGHVLVRHYVAKNAEVIAITRTPIDFPIAVKNKIWDGRTLDTIWANELNGADVVVNLAGKSVNCRYTKRNMKAIFDSRTYSTEVIAKAIQNCSVPPKLWINSASATIYRHAEDRPMDENTGELGSGFQWKSVKNGKRHFLKAERHLPEKLF